MFDIGFTEMMLIAVVALVVIGPERLPKVARTIGHLFGRAQRYVTDVKSEINREMEIEELRKLQAEMQSAARKVESDFTSTIRSTEDSIRKETRLDDIEKEVKAVASAGAASTFTSKEEPATTGSAEFDVNMESELDKAIAQAEALNAANNANRESSQHESRDEAAAKAGVASATDTLTHADSPKPTSTPS